MLKNLGLLAILLVLYSIGIQWLINSEIIIEGSGTFWGLILVFCIGGALVLVGEQIKLDRRY
jgi:hypothetical protein